MVHGASSAKHVTQDPGSPLQLQVADAQVPCTPGPPVQVPPGHVPAAGSQVPGETQTGFASPQQARTQAMKFSGQQSGPSGMQRSAEQHAASGPLPQTSAYRPQYGIVLFPKRLIVASSMTLKRITTWPRRGPERVQGPRSPTGQCCSRRPPSGVILRNDKDLVSLALASHPTSHPRTAPHRCHLERSREISASPTPSTDACT
jgi:hypothetical protein